MTIIKDPDGNAAAVDADNRLTVFADTQPWEQHRNREGAAFTLEFSLTPAGANDFFWYFENTGTFDIFLHKIRISSSVVTEIKLEHVTGTPVFVTGTDVPTLNKKLGSAGSISATNQFDTDITGLTSNGTLYFIEAAVANTQYTLDSDSNIIIPQGQAVALQRTEATGFITCQISMVVDSGTVGGS